MKPHQIPGGVEGLQFLRDFFAARDADSIRTASEGISREFGSQLPDVVDWLEVEYDFNRLFVGPAALPAPPYASAYEDDPTLMSPRTLEVRNLYRRMGLATPDQGSIPDDHISFELDALLGLVALENAGGPNAPDASAMREWLVLNHMSQWVPRFITAVTEEDASAPVLLAIRSLERWLDAERDRLADTQTEQSGEEDVHDQKR